MFKAYNSTYHTHNKDDYMWEARSKVVDNNVHKIIVFQDEVQLSCEDVIGYWCESYEFRDFYISKLKESSFEAFFWEHPPLTKSM